MQWAEFASKVACVHERHGSRSGRVGTTCTRQLTVVAEGLPLFGGMQLAIDATLVSPLHCDGAARPRCCPHRRCCVARRSTPKRAHSSGTCWPPFTVSPCRSWRRSGLAGGLRKQARLCGCWPKPRPVPNHPSCALGWNWHGGTVGPLFWRAAGRALLGLRGGGGADGDIPQPFDVERDWRHV